MTIDQLKSAAAVVRDATDDGENTALRVGQLFIDTIDTLSAIAANTLKGYKAITATSQLPDEPTPDERQLAYILGSTIYVYTGTGGDTLDGLYQSVNIKGPQGDKGDTGVTLGQVALVNDLTTGGDSDALAAEQGKTLKGLVDNLDADLEAVSEVLWESCEMTERKTLRINAAAKLSGAQFTEWVRATSVVPGEQIKINFEATGWSKGGAGYKAIGFFSGENEPASGDTVTLYTDSTLGHEVTLDDFAAQDLEIQLTVPSGGKWLVVSSASIYNVRDYNVTVKRAVLSAVDSVARAGVEALNDDIDDLATDLADLATDLADLATDLADLATHGTQSLLVIGDSLSAQASGGPVVWPTRLAAATHIDEVYNVAVGGAGISQTREADLIGQILRKAPAALKSVALDGDEVTAVNQDGDEVTATVKKIDHVIIEMGRNNINLNQPFNSEGNLAAIKAVDWTTLRPEVMYMELPSGQSGNPYVNNFASLHAAIRYCVMLLRNRIITIPVDSNEPEGDLCGIDCRDATIVWQTPHQMVSVHDTYIEDDDGASRGGWGTGCTMTYSLQFVERVVCEACNDLSVPVVKARLCAGISTQDEREHYTIETVDGVQKKKFVGHFLYDGTHLNDSGQKLYAKMHARALSGLVQ